MSSYINFRGKIYSLSGIWNSFKAKPSKKNLILGKIMPLRQEDIKYNNAPIKLTDTVLSSHTMILGTTGSGKTMLLKSMILQSLKQGHNVCWMDYKGELDILDTLKEAAEQLHIHYYEFSSRGCNFYYDPLVNLNETGKVEALLNTRLWSSDGADAHYKTSFQLCSQKLVRGYDAYRQETGDDSNYVAGLYKYSLTYKYQQSEKDGYLSIIKALEIILQSATSDIFDKAKKEFYFNDTEQYIVCFSFVSANKSLAASLSSFTLQDLMNTGTLDRFNTQIRLFIDEFGTLENSTIIKDLLEKGRSCGIACILALQDINQIAMNAGIFYVNSILGTIGNLVLFAGSTKQAAEIVGGVSQYDIDNLIMGLRRPWKHKAPTCLLISKSPVMSDKSNHAVYRFIPYIYQLSYDKKDKKEARIYKHTDNTKSTKDTKDTDGLNQVATDLTADTYREDVIEDDSNYSDDFDDVDDKNGDGKIDIHDLDDYL